MSKKEEDKPRPTVKSLIDDIVSPEAVARLQSRPRGRPPVSAEKPPGDKPESSAASKPSCTPPH